VLLAPEHGGRIAQITVDGLDLLAGAPSDGPLQWGCYPMVPWAGRLDRGILRFDGQEHRFPLTLPPHAIHGTTWASGWTVTSESADRATLAIDLAPPWPFGGRAEHGIALADDHLRLQLVVTAGEQSMPAAAGWHPWFRRSLSPGRPAELAFSAGSMWERGPDGLPTRRLVDPPPGPWDDCFTALDGPPTVTWPDALTLAIEHDCDHLVVYDEQADALCVEPQTLPPDGLNHGAVVLHPGDQLGATCTLHWRQAGR